MVCEFCRHEFDDSLTECPYCHKQVDFEPKSLTREERDSFSGTTIEMEEPGRYDGNAREGRYQDGPGYRDGNTYEGADRPYENSRDSSGIRVYRLGGLLTWIIFALVVLVIIFIVLPTFLIGGIICAVAGAVIIFLSRLFQ